MATPHLHPRRTPPAPPPSTAAGLTGATGLTGAPVLTPAAATAAAARRYLEPVEALVIEGGGVRGLAYGAALWEIAPLLRHGLRTCRTVAGTSAGALVALAVVLGYTAGEILELVTSTDWRAFRRRRWGGLLWSGGLYSLDGAHAFLEHTIVRKGYRPDITLRELHQKTLRTLKVCAWDEALDPPQTVVLDDLTAGDMPAVLAVAASMAIPGYFIPVRWRGAQLLDGGIANNFPVTELLRAGLAPRQILGLRVDDSAELRPAVRIKPPRLPHARLARLLQGLLYAANDRNLPEEVWAQTVRIEVPAEIRVTDFDLSAAQQSHLLEAGKAAALARIAWWAAAQLRMETETDPKGRKETRCRR